MAGKSFIMAAAIRSPVASESKAQNSGVSWIVRGANQRGLGPGARGGETARVGMKGKTTDRIDRRLTEDDGLEGWCANREIASVFAGTRRQSAPRVAGGATQLGANALALLIQ